MTSRLSGKTREISTELVQAGYESLMKDINLLRKYSSPLSQMAKIGNGDGRELTLMNLETKEFKYHPGRPREFLKKQIFGESTRCSNGTKTEDI